MILADFSSLRVIFLYASFTADGFVSLIYRLFGITPEESLAQTQVLHLKALQNGADILRVHEAHLQSSVFKLSKDLIDSIHEEGIVAYTS